MIKELQRATVRIQINGVTYTGEVEPRLLLCDFVRHHAGLKGTHVGCEQGVCGACTVLLNGRTARSCLTFAIQAHEGSVRTVEDLAGDGPLTPLQAAFHNCHALQCGFCTPGFLMVLTEFLEENPAPSEDEIIHVLSGNLCRCTGYINMIAAVKQAAAALRKIAFRREQHYNGA
jgi:aerobic-type carbon monoxide dehydrogenase small subunit (CoxS/CutS family)